jgi:hypothetical protein
MFEHRVSSRTDHSPDLSQVRTSHGSIDSRARSRVCNVQQYSVGRLIDWLSNNLAPFGSSQILQGPIIMKNGSHCLSDPSERVAKRCARLPDEAVRNLGGDRKLDRVPVRDSLDWLSVADRAFGY